MHSLSASVRTVEMYIDKFQRVVLIDEDHPLALAQRAQANVSSASLDPIADGPPTADPLADNAGDAELFGDSAANASPATGRSVSDGIESSASRTADDQTSVNSTSSRNKRRRRTAV